jgi:ubiquinone/menaquinone biosynthesis C-methylase UbiE
MDKIHYYSTKKVAKNYDQQRFGGLSGQQVNQKELNFIVQYLAPQVKKVLDAPCGTGRLIKKLKSVKQVIGLDSSMAMIKEAKKNNPQRKIIQGNLFHLPFDKNSFDAVIHLRIFHHYPSLQVEKIIRQSRRILKKNGQLIFDTYSRSPKIWLNYFYPQSVHKVYLHPDEKIKKMLREMDFGRLQFKKAFIFSPLIYRFLPLWLIKFLDKIEKSWPQKFLVRSFWQAEKK